MNCYADLAGAAIIIISAGMLSTDIVAQKNKICKRYKTISVYFSLLADSFITGTASLPENMMECTDEKDSELYFVISKFIDCIIDSEIATIELAWEKFCKDVHHEKSKYMPEIEYLERFASCCASGGLQARISAAQELSKQAEEDYKTIKDKSKQESKLILYSGVCAGILVVIMLI